MARVLDAASTAASRKKNRFGRVRGASVVLAGAILLSAPQWMPPFYITLLNYIALYALVTVGVILLTGVAGLTSYGQAAFVGIGAYTTAVFTTQAAAMPAWLAWIGASPWLTLCAGWCLTAAVAWILGRATLRLSGHFLPLGTIAWGLSLYFCFGALPMLGGNTGIANIPPIHLAGMSLGDGRHLYYLIWIFLALGMWAVRNLLHSREGRAIRALRGGVVMAEAMGVDTPRAKMTAFLIAALLASASGWLYAHMQQFVNPVPFNIQASIDYVFMAVVGGAGQVWGALIGAAVITLLKDVLQDVMPRLLGQNENVETIVFGLAMVLILHHARDGVLHAGARLWRAIQHRARTGAAPGTHGANAEAIGRAASGTSAQGADAASETPHAARRAVESDLADHAGVAQAAPLPRRPLPPRGETVLVAADVTRRFGGLVANDAMNLSVATGEILALLGPNGAGKSTMFNQISGVDTPTSGQVLFRGTQVAGRGARQIARLGMSRTFQHVRLLPKMSVLENVALGAHTRGVAGIVRAVLRLDREEERRLLAEAARQLTRVGLGAYLYEEAGALALGQQRLLEIARALASDPCVLLLDEPAAGLRYHEKQALAALLSTLRDEGLAILIVEHDMEFVMNLVDRVIVMEFGKKIAEGTPTQIQDDPVVQRAYLGDGDE
ncbi:branched-chain amino acid ABC transporter ATP-binding protein/permease [Robbsia sp. KACC 23696]|uniref:branched-chain amino acid ABC transporter ATP-binding protein/permease n=1 Tax=Robbsia sp. KACC 23696 TaxID=3149231 RepID=UPI00325B8810